MIKNNFLVVNLKKIAIPLIFSVFTVCLILFSRTNINAAKDGLSLWANSVVPSLLPFFIATNLLSYTDIPRFLGKLLDKIMRPLFNVPGMGSFAFIMGIISGYPIGAKIAASFKEEAICTPEEAERLIAFTNNSGPLFIIGTVGVAFLGDTRTGILLFLTHILACISVGVIFRWWKKDKKEKSKTKKIKELNSNVENKTVSLNNLGEVLRSSIMNAISTIVMIGGFVVLFSVVLSILNQSNFFDLLSNILRPLGINEGYIKGIASGIIELTNGLKQVASVPNKMLSINVTICSFILGFGGLSVLLQVLSITSKANISIKPYFIGKLLHGSLAALYTYLILKYSSFFNLDIVTTMANTATKATTTSYSFIVRYYSSIS